MKQAAEIVAVVLVIGASAVAAVVMILALLFRKILYEEIQTDQNRED